MIYGFAKLIFNTLIGGVISFFNINFFIQDFKELLNGIVGILVGIATIIFLIFQIKKIILDIKINKKKLQ